jgi:hypothetical protein
VAELPYRAGKRSIVDAINEFRSSGGAGPGILQHQGVYSGARSNEGYPTIELGQIVAAGPNGEADYTDYRYWVQRTGNQITLGVNDADTQTLDIEILPDCDDPTSGTGPRNSANNSGASSALLPQIITAYNLDDYASGIHGLPIGKDVKFIWTFFDIPTDSTAPGTFRYLLLVGPSLPTPQYDGMGLFTVSQNQLGGKYVSAHPMTQGGGSGAST